ncbi:MAG: hypothetical protein RH862_07885 [Leptospiraceae bacterium]
MDEYLNCIVDVPLPELEGGSLKNFENLRASARPVKAVSSANIEWTSNSGESIFQGIPDEDELSRSFGCKPFQARQLLNFEVHCFRLMRIRLESASYEINRKTEGYIVANDEVLSILEERIRRQLNGLLSMNANPEQAVQKYGDYFLDNVTVLEGNLEGKLIRLYLAIRQVQSKMEQFEMFGTSQFHEVLERRILKRLETLEANVSDAAVAEGNKHSFPEPPSSRRAEDSPIWKEFEKDQLQKLESAEVSSEGTYREGSISWAASFSALGPFFTVRILLRRELYPEILHWLVQDEGRYSPELPRILMDCLKSEENYKDRTGDVPGGLQEVITSIQQILRDH